MAWDDKKVMLVDGSATLRYYYGILLKRLAFTVMVAESGEEALKIIQNTVPALILTDVTLPRMSGIEFIQTIKGSALTSAVPVIAFVGQSDASVRSSCLSIGCVDFLTKRVDPDHLYRSIQAALEPKPRGHMRLNMPLKVVVGDGTSQGGAERTEYATTISEGGLYLRTLFPRPKNSFTPVRIIIKNRTVRAQAAVLYSHAMEGGFFKEPGMGMKFIEISPEDRSFVRRFIKEQLTSDIVIGT